MSQSHPRSKPAGRPDRNRPIPAPPSPSATPKARRARIRGLGLIVLTGTLLAGVGAWWFRPTPMRPPSLALESVDPKVAAVLEQHRQEVVRNPQSGAAWGWLGALLWVYDFRADASRCLARAAELDPVNPRWPYYHGLALMITSPGAAVAQFQRAVQLCGNEPEAPRMRLARLLGEQERWAEVEAELKPLLEVKPDYAPARLLVARAAHARGDRDHAIELARACSQDPRTRKAAWALLTLLLREQGDLPGAAVAARYAQAAPADEGMGDPFEAEVTLRRPDARALTEQAHPLLASGHRNAAAALIDRLVREHPEYPDTWLLVGRMLLLNQQLPEAEQALQKHLELSPRSTQGLFQLGLVLLARKQPVEAAHVFGRATELKPDFGPAHFNRGLALLQAGQPRDAIDAFRETLRYNPERLDTYLYLAEIYLRLGERTEARSILGEARTLAPDHPRLRALMEQAGQP